MERGDQGIARGAIGLDAPFETWPARGCYRRVALAPNSDEIELFELRRYLHRASRVLEPGGEVRWWGGDGDPHRDRQGVLRPRRGFEPAARQPPRGLRIHAELVRLFPLSLGTPRRRGRAVAYRAWRLPPEQESHYEDPDSHTYDPSSRWRELDRLEEPEVLDDFLFGLARAAPPLGGRVLALGMNDGRELAAFGVMGRDDLCLSGIDWSEAAIAEARRRFPDHAARLIARGLEDIGQLGLSPADLVLALNVLQCRTVDRDQVLRDAIALVASGGSLLISIPTGRHGPEGLIRRSLLRGLRGRDLATVDRLARHFVRTLHRHQFANVETFGTYDRFVLARRAPRDLR